MRRYIAQRMAAALVTLIGVSLLIFMLVRLLPGDPARVIAGLLADEREVERIRVQMGLNRPLPQQYALFFTHFIRGDLGTSARTGQPVLKELLARMPYSLELAAVSTLLAVVVGVAAGVLAATRRNTPLDYLISLGTLIGISMPVYWLGLLLIILFAVKLHWLPAAGADQPASLILPALTLAAFSVALITRMTRASLFDVLGQDYIRTARAKGVAQRVVVYRHGLRNAMVPIVTVIGLQLGGLVGGAVLTETVFGWPGLGQLLVNSIFSRDFPMVQGLVLTAAGMIILINLGVDLFYAYVDPRIHFS